ncbi:MAG: hypothetical protein JWM59_251 [Verrucomicrobiales bacterium]|nr:hypothetical protein [Verrucomicrobiales bacterium]
MGATRKSRIQQTGEQGQTREQGQGGDGTAAEATENTTPALQDPPRADHFSGSAGDFQSSASGAGFAAGTRLPAPARPGHHAGSRNAGAQGGQPPSVEKAPEREQGQERAQAQAQAQAPQAAGPASAPACAHPGWTAGAGGLLPLGAGTANAPSALEELLNRRPGSAFATTTPASSAAGGEARLNGLRQAGDSLKDGGTGVEFQKLLEALRAIENAVMAMRSEDRRQLQRVRQEAELSADRMRKARH